MTDYDAMRSTIPFLITLLAVVVYVGSIFFFCQRRAKRPGDMSEWALPGASSHLAAKMLRGRFRPEVDSFTFLCG